MKKYIVLSVNENPEYLFYLPLTCWAWRKFGWTPLVFKPSEPDNGVWRYVRDTLNKTYEGSPLIYYTGAFRELGYGTDMIAQVSRLYAACREIGYLMTGDVDMIPLSNYWNPNEEEITVWGHDLTGYQHYPICYIGMPSYRWMEIMDLTSNDYNRMIKRDLNSMPNASCDDPVKRWVVDQDLITERLNDASYPINRINRLTYANGYPIGRVDRSAWTLNHEKLIDCHMPRGIYSNHHRMEEIVLLLEKVWPEENFDWFIDYKDKFKQLVNG